MAFVCAGVLLGCSEAVQEFQVSPNIVDLSSSVSPIHDPSIIESGETYYVYSSSSLGSFYTSPDMRTWTLAGTVFEALPTWLTDQVPAADHIGAPDISYHRGRYLLFYQSHESGTCDAATGLATNSTLDPSDASYEWVDHGLVLRSKPYFPGFGLLCGGFGAVYNAIDAHFFEDVDGRTWLVFGSTIGGIKLVELDPETLALPAEPEFITLAQRFLLGRDPVIEAPYIVHRDSWYYLFLSFNHCCRGAATKYQIRVGRAGSLAGPYYDRDGWPLKLGGGTLLIARDGPLIGTGHADIFSDSGQDWLVHHAKDPARNDLGLLSIRRMEWDPEGWPSVRRD